MKLDTLIVKGIEAKNNPNKAVIPPVFLASTFVQDDLENFQEFAYSRGSNPTKKAFDEIFAKVEGSKYAFSFGSGMAATAAALSLIKTGQKVLLNSNVYGGTYRYVTTVFESHGIKSEFIDDLNFLSEDDISDDVAAIFIETPSNPLLRVTDIARISKIAHKKGALVIVDNTFLTPYYQRVLDHGADIVVYSATKYIGGHADVIAGIVTLNDDALAEKIKFAKNTLGGIISPMDAYYLIRGLKTLSVRFDRQTQNTHKIIKFLQNNDAVSVVHFAGSYSEQEAKMQAAQASGIGALISFELDEKYDVNKFVKSLEIFDLAVSLGGVESLICRPTTMTHEAYPKEVLDKIGIKQNLLRLAIGIENADDLIADLDQAFKKAKKIIKETDMATTKFKGSEVNLSGNEVFVGSYAPEAKVVAQDLSEFSVGGNNGVEVLVCLPSLDTGVCAAEARKFNEKVAGKHGVKLSIISNDLPFAMGRFCTTEGIANLHVGSDFRYGEFAKNYGVLMSDGPLKGLLARAVFVINDGVIIHKQIVPEVTEEPNYDAVFDAIKSSGSCGCGCH